MDLPKDRLYARSHTWIKKEDGAYLLGLTEYALDEIMGIIYIALPETGETIQTGKNFVRLESMKTAVEIASPISGVVCETNQTLMEYPPIVSEKPYDTWLVRVKQSVGEMALLNAQDYSKWAETECNKDEE